MATQADLSAEFDFISAKKFKKTTGYERVMKKNIDKAKKAKIGKSSFTGKVTGKSLRLTSSGKKPSPVSEIDFTKVKMKKNTTPQTKVLSVAYPGTDAKSPINIYTMRFKESDDYTKISQCMDARDVTPVRDPSRRQSTTEVNESAKKPSERRDPSTKRSSKRQPRSSSRRSYTSSSNSRFTSSSSSSSSSSRDGRSSKRPGVLSYVTTDHLLNNARLMRRSPSPTFRITDGPQASYISTTAHIRLSSPPKGRRGRSKDVSLDKRVYRARSYGASSINSSSSSSDSSRSSSGSRRTRVLHGDCFRPYRHRLRRFSSFSSSNSSFSLNSSYSSSSSDLSSDSSQAPYIHGRNFVISKCKGSNGTNCRPVAGLTVTKDTPGFEFNPRALQ